jgi:RND family efflux transporter MFP subunit
MKRDVATLRWNQDDCAFSGERVVYRRLLFVSLPVTAIFLVMVDATVLADPPVRENHRDVVVLHHCDLDYEQSTLISGHSGTGFALPLQDSLVRLGDHVKAGQVIGRVFDRDLRVQVALRKAESDSDIEVRLAEAKRNELAQKLKRIEKLRGHAQPYASDEEYESARVLFESAQLMIEDARYKRRIARIQCDEIEAQIGIREIVAPHDGHIVEVFKKPGEAVLAGQPVFQIVKADRLRVTAYSNLSDYNRIRPGQRIEISLVTDVLDPDLLQRTFAGKVIFVDKRIDAKSQTCRIIAEVENQDLALAAGLEARMTIYTATTAPDTSARINSADGRELQSGRPAATR